jgi:hypothetical protein
VTAGVVLEAGTGRALIFDRVTGAVMRCSVPTALENVRLGQGRYVHGETGEPMKAPPVAAVAEPAPIALAQDDVLPLPEEAPAPEKAEPFGGKGDHDNDGKPGGDVAAATPAKPKPARRAPPRRRG